MKQLKWITGVLPVLLIAMLLGACENDLNKVKQISALEMNTPIDTTLGVDVIYSDSAKVKAHLLSPLMLTHTVTNPYHEMPKGVKIIFFDDKINQKGADPEKHILATVVADYAVTHDNDNLIELRRNVVVSNPQGDTFKSEELFWDKNKQLLYSNKRCELNKVDGTALEGTSFKSNQTFTDYRFEQGKGDVVTKGNLTE